MRLSRTRTVVGGLVVLAGIALAGCGAADKVSTTASAAEAVRFAGQQAAAESYAFEMTIGLEFNGLDEFEVSAEGVADASEERGRISMELLGRRTEIILDGTTIYARTDEHDTWTRSEMDGPAVDVPGGGWDMKQHFAFLRSVSDEVAEVGTEKVRGVETTKYRAFVSFDRAFENLSDEDREMIEEVTTFFEGDGFDIFVWVDGEGRPAKVEYTANMDFQGSEMSMRYEMELFDWGKDVDVELPPEDKVVDGGAYFGEGWN